MDFAYLAGDKDAASESFIMIESRTDPNTTFTPSESTTIISGGLHRTLSDIELDQYRAEAYSEIGNLRTSLQLQLNSLRPAKQFVSTVSRLITEMTSVISTYLDPTASLVPFGSIASNLCLNESSVDLLVFIPPTAFAREFGSSRSNPPHHPEIPVGMVKEYEVRQSMRRALVRISELLTVFCSLYLVKLTNVVPLASVSSTSRVPVLTMIEPISGTTLEIVCNTALPLFSTRLVKSYNSLVPTGELRDCILLVKHWARQHDLLGSGVGELSGYAWTLLCIFYCQACLRLMPSLQGLSAERQQWTDPFGSNRRCDVGFADEKTVPEALLPDGVSLFIGFIDFYANYWNWKSGVISVRLGKAVMVESAEVFIKQPAIERSNALIIEDPFDIKKDICIGSLDRLRNQIMETAMLLTEDASLVDIMGPFRIRQQRTDSAF